MVDVVGIGTGRLSTGHLLSMIVDGIFWGTWLLLFFWMDASKLVLGLGF